jgi:hypothetical protein
MRPSNEKDLFKEKVLKYCSKLKKTIDDLSDILIALSGQGLDISLKNLIDQSVYQDVEDFFFKRTVKKLATNKYEFQEDDILKLKNALSENGLSSSVIKKIYTTIILKNNSENRAFFSLIKRLVGFNSQVVQVEDGIKNILIFTEGKLFDGLGGLNLDAVEKLNNWLDNESVLVDGDVLQTAHNLSKIKFYIRMIEEIVIL